MAKKRKERIIEAKNKKAEKNMLMIVGISTLLLMILLYWVFTG